VPDGPGSGASAPWKAKIDLSSEIEPDLGELADSNMGRA
jgi:hypothetical protein